MTDATILITGATQGIGWACAEKLAKTRRFTLLIAARSKEVGERVVAQLGSEARSVVLDLASLASVRCAADQIVRKLGTGDLPPLRGLILNAGMQTASGPLRYTADGYEVTFATNHLGHFLLTNLLLGHLAAPGRIVVTASGTHDPDTNDGRFNKPVFTNAAALAHPDRPDAPRMSHLQRYATSKLCNIYFTYELSRRLNASGRSIAHAPITANAFDPGAVPGTSLLREHGRIARWLFQSPVVRLLTRVETIDDAGAALARLMTDDALATTTGRYFAGLRERRSSQASYDEGAARALWSDSAALVGLTASNDVDGMTGS